jgi:diacylglycerol O-acyltransferase
MADRLSPLDASFLYLEDRTTPMHVGAVVIFDEPEGRFDYDRLVRLISERLSLVPRYRQKVRWVPGHLANPVWVDDPDFDITYHVRRSALPRPGSDAQLRELVARLQSRPLDRERPLWEVYLVEGLSENRVAIITKTHHAVVDGIAAIDIGSVMLDVTPETRATPRSSWRPRSAPSSVELVGGAVVDWLRRPAYVADAARTTALAAVTDARRVAEAAGRTVTGLFSAARSQVRSAPSSPLNATIGEQRRFGMAATSLEDYKRIRKAHGGTVNDVVLAVVSGALRSWLLTRGERVTASTSVRAMVPVSIRGPIAPTGEQSHQSPQERETAGNRVASYFVELPVGEPDPVVRLSQVSYEMEAHKAEQQFVGAEALIGLSGFAPPTMHAAAARLISDWSRRVFNTVVTNVPGPQFPLYAAGARMRSLYPVVPLVKGQAVSIGITSYDGGLYYGLNADRDAMPDVDVLAQCLEEALSELLETAD